jgi:hypothetical protein
VCCARVRDIALLLSFCDPEDEANVAGVALMNVWVRIELSLSLEPLSDNVTFWKQMILPLDGQILQCLQVSKSLLIGFWLLASMCNICAFFV